MNLGLNNFTRKLYTAANFNLICNLIKQNHVEKLRVSKVGVSNF